MNTKELEAVVEKIYPTVVKKTKSGEDFVSQKVLVVFDLDQEFPSKIVLEQGGQKKVDLVSKIEEGKTYLFSLNFRGNTRVDASGNETAFGSISAWKIEPVIDPAKEEDKLPF